MLRVFLFRLAVFCLTIGLLVSSVRAEIRQPDGIEWVADLGQAIQLAKAKHVPLVVYIFSQNEDGTLALCREFEAGTLSSRELNAYRKDAIFVKANAARDDSGGYVRKLFMDLKVTEVPTVSVLECRDEVNLATKAIVGNLPTSDFVRLFRKGLVETIVSIRLRDRTPCTDAEFVRGVETFRAEFSPLVMEFSNAYRRHLDTLNKLSTSDGLQVKDLEEADRILTEVQTTMSSHLMKFLDLNRAEIQELCIAEFELHGNIRDNLAFLRADLMLFTIDGQIAGTFPTTMARLAVSKSQRQFDEEFQKRTKSFEEIKYKLDQRYDEIVKRQAVDFAKR